MTRVDHRQAALPRQRLVTGFASRPLDMPGGRRGRRLSHQRVPCPGEAPLRRRSRHGRGAARAGPRGPAIRVARGGGAGGRLHAAAPRLCARRGTPGRAPVLLPARPAESPRFISNGSCRAGRERQLLIKGGHGGGRHFVPLDGPPGTPGNVLPLLPAQRSQPACGGRREERYAGGQPPHPLVLSLNAQFTPPRAPGVHAATGTATTSGATTEPPRRGRPGTSSAATAPAASTAARPSGPTATRRTTSSSPPSATRRAAAESTIQRLP